MKKEPEQLLLTAEAAEQLRMHPETVREYIRRGELKAIKFAGAGRRGIWKVRQSEVDRFLKRNEYNP